MKEIVMTSLLTVAVLFDIRQKRIPNQLILSGIAICLFLGFRQNGMVGVGRGIFTFLAVLSIFWPLFLLRAVGAGDIKLLALIGAMHNLHFFSLVAVVFFVLSGIGSFVILCKEKQFCKRIKYAFGYLAGVGRRQGMPYYDKSLDGTDMTITLAPFTMAAYLLVAIGRWWEVC